MEDDVAGIICTAPPLSSSPRPVGRVSQSYRFQLNLSIFEVSSAQHGAVKRNSKLSLKGNECEARPADRCRTR